MGARMDQMGITLRTELGMQDQDPRLSKRLCHIHLSPPLRHSIQVHIFYLPPTNTPLSSSPTDIIPIPRPGLQSSASLFSTPAERDEARQGLESLNSEASDPSNTSQRLEETLQTLKELLHTDKLTT